MDFNFIIETIPALLKATVVTMYLALAAASIGWILGFFIALIRKEKVPVLSQVLGVFVSFMRGVPLIILLYVSYFALPLMIQNYYLSIGRTVDVNAVPKIVYAIAALVLDQAAYSSEAIRSALSSVDNGQLEGAYSVGMTKPQAIRRIILPQAIVVAIPNLGGLFLGLVKGTSLTYYVGMMEITATAQIAAIPAYNFIEAYVMITVIYEIISLIINKFFGNVEAKLSRSRLAKV